MQLKLLNRTKYRYILKFQTSKQIKKEGLYKDLLDLLNKSYNEENPSTNVFPMKFSFDKGGKRKTKCKTKCKKYIFRKKRKTKKIINNK